VPSSEQMIIHIHLRLKSDDLKLTQKPIIAYSLLKTAIRGGPTLSGGSLGLCRDAPAGGRAKKLGS